MSIFILTFVAWIVGGHVPMTSGKSVAASTISMTDTIKRTDNMAKKKTLDEVKLSFRKVWGDRFNYDLITEENYVNTTTKVPVICKEHGVFLQTPHDHLYYCGCKTCANNSRSVSGVPRENTRKRIYNVGINDSTSATSYKGKKCKSYDLWKAMLARCYSPQSIGTSYENCCVCDSWHYYTNFERWFNSNYKEGYHLDKDIIVRGNKVYSPDTCCFVPPEINTLIVKHNATRGNLPIGVSKRSKSHKYRALLRKYGEYVTLGSFSTPEDAFTAYKEAKEKHIQEMAAQYFNEGKITEKVYNALMNYKVEITD